MHPYLSGFVLRTFNKTGEGRKWKILLTAPAFIFKLNLRKIVQTFQRKKNCCNFVHNKSCIIDTMYSEAKIQQVPSKKI